MKRGIFFIAILIVPSVLASELSKPEGECPKLVEGSSPPAPPRYPPATGRAVDRNRLQPIDSAREGAVRFEELTRHGYPREYLHPIEGRLRILGSDSDQDGHLIVDGGAGSIRHLYQQNGLVLAVVGTPAENALTVNRCDAFAPATNIALLYYLNYLNDMKGDRRNGGIYARHRQVYETLFRIPPGIESFDAFVERAVGAMQRHGIRHDNLLLDPIRIKLAAVAREVASLGDGDPMAAAVAHWARATKEDHQLPLLGLRISRGGRTTPFTLSKQVVDQRWDIVEHYTEQLTRRGLAVLVGDDGAAVEALGSAAAPAFTPQLPDKVTILSTYYTNSHPKHETDWLTGRLKEIERIAKLHGRYKLSVPAIDRRGVGVAKEVIAEFRPELEKVEVKRFDFILPVPGSGKSSQNRAYYLALALAQELGHGDGQFWNVIGRNASWDGTSQKSAGDVTDRVRNAAKKFSLSNANGVRGKRILLVEDTTTSGVTIDTVRHLLIEAGAEVEVLAFAQTVAAGQTPTTGRSGDGTSRRGTQVVADAKTFRIPGRLTTLARDHAAKLLEQVARLGERMVRLDRYSQLTDRAQYTALGFDEAEATSLREYLRVVKPWLQASRDNDLTKVAPLSSVLWLEEVVANSPDL